MTLRGSRGRRVVRYGKLLVVEAEIDHANYNEEELVDR